MRLVAMLLIVATLLSSRALPAAGAQSRPASRFGVVNAYEAPEAAAELGVGWEQITFEWAAFQPSGPHEWVTRPVDPAWLETAANAGREIVGLIRATPRWASPSGELSAVPEGLDLPASDPGNVWAAFVTRLVETYAPRGVHRWIIYDEPNVPPGEGHVQFAGEVDDYARLLQIAYFAATSADPRARIHVAGMNGWVDAAAGRDPYLSRLLAVLQRDGSAAYGYYFDAVMVHAYDSTQAVWDVTTQTRAALDNAGLIDKPIWLITNARPAADSEEHAASPVFHITPDQQADFVLQAVVISFALGVERIAIDQLVDAPALSHDQRMFGAVTAWVNTARDELPAWGLMRADGSHRPAFEAYRTAIQMTAPTTAVEWYSHPAADLIILEQGDRDVYVMWARTATPASFVITSSVVGEQAAFYDTRGQIFPAQSDAIEWPAAFTVDVSPAAIDTNGFLTVAGSPRALVLDRSDFYRVVYLDVANERIRLK